MYAGGASSPRKSASQGGGRYEEKEEHIRKRCGDARGLPE